MARRKKKDEPIFPCVDCKRDAIWNDFMVTDRLWKRIGVKLGHLCYSCLSQRVRTVLKREIRLRDFPRDIPSNYPIYFGYCLWH